MRAVLVGSSGLVLGREYALDAPVVTIGRRDENTIVIKDPTVSRKHAEILREGESYSIVDKGSTSGITVNGQLIVGQQALRDGDRIGIGSSAVFLIQLQQAEDRTIAFSQQQFAESGKTQFITRELGDPRATPATPDAPPPVPQDRYRPNETQIHNTPSAPAAPPQRPAPPPPPPSPSFSPPASSGPAWSEPPRPSVDLGGPAFSPSTMPEMPRPRADSAPPPAPDFGGRFDPPPPPAGNYPPMSAVTEFAPNSPGGPGVPMGAPPPPQFGAPPSFSSPPQPGYAQLPAPLNQPPMAMNAPGPMMAPPPPPAGAQASGGRTGLIIALIVVVVLVVVAAVVVGLLLTGNLG